MFDGGSGADSAVDLLTLHYPGLGFDPAPFSSNTKPTSFGEYAHLNCYNRREILTDPGTSAFGWNCRLHLDLKQ